MDTINNINKTHFKKTALGKIKHREHVTSLQEKENTIYIENNNKKKSFRNIIMSRKFSQCHKNSLTYLSVHKQGCRRCSLEKRCPKYPPQGC